MGNTLKTNKVINIECPICLDVAYNPIKLHCKHQFCHYCIQKWSVQYVYFKKLVQCPYCRDLLYESELLKIFKKNVCADFKLEEYSQYNIYNIEEYKLSITSVHNIPLYSQYGFYKIGLPQFNSFINPIFIKIPRVYRLKHDTNQNDSILKLTNRLAYAKTEYGENLGQYKYIINGFIGKTSWMDLLVDRFHKLELLNTDMIKNVYDSKDRIRLYIKDPKDVLVIDNINGTMTKGLKIMNFISEVIFKMIIISDNDNNVYLINELQCIRYYE